MTIFTGQVEAISNKATWRSKTAELVDDDGATVDLSDPSIAVDISVTIARLDYPETALATASTSNGQVIAPGPGFYWQFEVSDLTNLCAGTYRLDAKAAIEGIIYDLINGTVAVIEGNP